MIEKTRKASGLLRWIALLLCVGFGLTVRAEERPTVTLQLKNGDRLTGEVLSEDDERIVLSTPWNVAIYVPKSEIQRQTTVVSTAETNRIDAGAATLISGTPTPGQPVESKAPGGGSEAGQAPKLAKVKPPASGSIHSKTAKRWRWNAKLGTDFISGAKDRQIYFAQTSLTYTRNYRRDPKEFLRNKVDYSVNYGETDGEVSANSMLAYNKLDFDIGADFYGYGALGAGYDRVRKIESQYEVGPGLGYHLLAEKNLALDAELGVNYQDREGLDDAPDWEVMQGRIANELTWEVAPKITLSEQAAILPFLDDLGEYQIRVEGNVGFGIVRYLSLNLTIRNVYDTMPAPGVPNNEFQFRSSLGVNF